MNLLTAFIFIRQRTLRVIQRLQNMDHLEIFRHLVRQGPTPIFTCYIVSAGSELNIAGVGKRRQPRGLMLFPAESAVDSGFLDNRSADHFRYRREGVSGPTDFIQLHWNIK